MDFFLRDGDEQKAEGAVHMDDIDLVISPKDGRLVVVAMKNGRHVCQYCGEGFNQAVKRLMPVEVTLSPGCPAVLLHAGCEAPSPRVVLTQRFKNNLRGMQARRFYAQATKPLEHLTDKISKIVG